MRSIKSVLVALVAVLAFGAVAASGASAHEFNVEGKSMKELGLHEEATSSELGEVVLTGNGVQINCAGGSGTGTIREGGAGIATLNLGACFVAKPANCATKALVLSNTIDSLVEVGGKLADEFAGHSEERLFTLEITSEGGSCAAAGVWPEYGQITGSVASETEKEVGELNFSLSSGSALSSNDLIGQVRFKDKVKLSGSHKGQKWSARK